MNKEDFDYWYENLDRLGILFGGVFIGALAEMGLTKIGITLGIAGLTCCMILIKFIEIKIKKEQKR
jgi:hypothetical protein